MSTPYLDQLARVLATAGWSSRPRYEQVPALLHVFSPCLPALGESVRVKAGVGGVPWFVGSSGDPIGPCHDLAGAVDEIGARLGPYVATAAVVREKGDGVPRRLVDRVRAAMRG